MNLVKIPFQDPEKCFEIDTRNIQCYNILSKIKVFHCQKHDIFVIWSRTTK